MDNAPDRQGSNANKRSRLPESLFGGTAEPSTDAVSQSDRMLVRLGINPARKRTRYSDSSSSTVATGSSKTTSAIEPTPPEIASDNIEFMTPDVDTPFGPIAYNQPYWKVLNEKIFKVCLSTGASSKLCNVCVISLKDENVQYIVDTGKTGNARRCSRCVLKRVSCNYDKVANSIMQKARFLYTLGCCAEADQNDTQFQDALNHFRALYTDALVDAGLVKQATSVEPMPTSLANIAAEMQNIHRSVENVNRMIAEFTAKENKSD